MTTNNLTEQWKKGELEKGKKYWCKLQDGKSEICYLWLQTNHFTYLTGYQSTCLPDEYILEVLAPLPSYEELEQLQNWADFTNDYHELREKLEIADYKNAELKELLRECRGCFDYLGVDDVMINKIDEVLK